MKVETLIFVVAIVIIGLLIVKDFVPELEKFGSGGTTEANQVSIENDVQKENIIKEDQNNIETPDTSVNDQNVIDVSGIQELKNQLN